MPDQAHKQKAGLIILGAQDFPRSNFRGSEALLIAKERITNYFSAADGLALTADRILDFFDSNITPTDLDDEIERFITENKGKGLADLFIYYVGHGSFHDEKFYLAIRKSKDDNPLGTSLIFRSIADRVINSAHDIRTYFIIDCCFAAAAGEQFLANEGTVIIQHLRAQIPQRGTAMLCATSAQNPAYIIENRNISQFTEALEMALKSGNPDISAKYLTLRQIHKLTLNFIISRGENSKQRPELLCPYQPEGNVADVALFLNHATKLARSNILAKRDEIYLACFKNHLDTAKVLFIDYCKNFDIKRRYRNRAVHIAIRCDDLIANEALRVEKQQKLGGFHDKATLQAFRTERDNLYDELTDLIDLIYNGDLPN